MKRKSYLISGAGSGIGRATALRIASQPENRVILLGRNQERLEEVRRELPGEGHEILVLDLKDSGSFQKTFSSAKLGEKNLVAVIANAGLGGPNAYGPGDRWEEIIQTNLSGTYRLIQECLPALRASQETYRHIVVTSSVLARLGVPGYSAYCASKAGLLGLTRSWAAEYAADRILVNAICPGWVDTEMSKEGLEDIAKATGQSFADVRKIEMGRVPLGKMSQPEEIASFISFLVSGAQISITGQSLDINGGAVMP